MTLKKNKAPKSQRNSIFKETAASKNKLYDKDKVNARNSELSKRMSYQSNTLVLKNPKKIVKKKVKKVKKIESL